jgi:uncharacterized protein (DUF433 family)
METRLSAHIVLDPGIRFGKPCIKGTRIAVVDVLEWLASGLVRIPTKEGPILFI